MIFPLDWNRRRRFRMKQDGRLEKGKVMETEDLVEYQADSVVSRTLIDKKVGTVTAFAFDEGQGLSEHTTPFDAMVQVLDGRVEITISGNAIEVSEGEMVIMPASEPHALKALTPFKMLLTMIRE
jgi:quercetin dioxygenase-like cupin family protein